MHLLRYYHKASYLHPSPLSGKKWLSMIKTHNIGVDMSNICQVTGKRPITGHNVSHSHLRTKRRFLPNIHEQRIWVPEENRYVKLKVSAKGLRIIDKKGIKAVLADLRKRGVKV